MLHRHTRPHYFKASLQFGALLLLVLDAGCSGDNSPPLHYAWENVTSATQFAGRDGAGALVYEDKIWLLGGWNQNGAFPNGPTTNEVWNSSDGMNWTLIKPDTTSGWEPRHMAGWLVFQNKMWILGGDNNRGHYQYDIWNSRDGVTWNLVTDDAPWANRAPSGQPPSGRVLHYTLVFDNKMWVMGGQSLPQLLDPPPDPLPPTEYYRDAWSSSDGVNWTQVATDVPWAKNGRGMICGAVVFDGKMWVIGGGTYWSSDPDQLGVGYNDVWSSGDGVNWTQVTAKAPWLPRRYHNVAVFNYRMWVMAGVPDDATAGNGPFNDVWSSSDGAHWTSESATAASWPARHAASAFVYQGALWMTAGTPVQPYQLNDVWKYGPVPEPPQ